MPRAQGPKSQVDGFREQLKSGDRGGSDADRDVLLEFSDRLTLLRETYSWHRHIKLLRHCARLSEHAEVQLVDTLSDHDATETVVRWIHDEYDLDASPETNQNYRVALRMFGKRIAETDDTIETELTGIPPSIAWVTTTLPSSYDPMPREADMLRWDEDIQAMFDGCRNSRDAAAIALQFDAGLRGDELETLTIGQLSDTATGLVVSVDGKTGQRSVDLIPSVPYINRWLSDHPGGSESDPLWCKLSSPEEISYTTYSQMFSKPAERVGLTKPVTPTNFRKSNACWLARQGASQTLIEDRQGRKRGSEHTSRYIARFGRESANRQYRVLHGLEVEETDEEDIAPVTCPRCEKRTPEHEPCCVWCGQALSPEAAKESRELSKFIRDALAQTDDPEKVQALLDVGEMSDERGDFRARLVNELLS